MSFWCCCFLAKTYSAKDARLSQSQKLVATAATASLRNNHRIVKDMARTAFVQRL